MKIIYGITKSNFGGAQRYVFDLALGAKKEGHDVSVICGGSGRLQKILSENSIKVIPIDSLDRDISIIDDWRSFKKLLEIIKSEKPDVFHTNSSKMGGLGNLVGRLVNIKRIIFTSHGWAYSEKWRPLWQKKILVLLNWFIILLSHKTICVSEKTKIDAPRFLNKKKLIVIKNGLDPVKVYERDYARKILEVNNDEFLVGTLSELHRIKGLDILLKAWQMFRVKLPGKLIIFGEGEEKDNLLELVKKLNIENDVVFKGFNIDASKLISGFDVFIMSSISENMPYALLEAGSAGRAVIATRVGGIPEVVENNISGILIKPNDKDELVCGLEKLYKDSELRNNLGKALYDNVNTNFSLKKMIKETFKVYEY